MQKSKNPIIESRNRKVEIKNRKWKVTEKENIHTLIKIGYLRNQEQIAIILKPLHNLFTYIIVHIEFNNYRMYNMQTF